MSIKEWLAEQKGKVDTNIKKFANKEFMEAVAAGCALVAYADGTVSTEEKQKMVGYIQINDSLKAFKLNDILERFNHYVSTFDFDFNVGKVEAMKSVSKLKSKPEAAKLLISLCCAIGASDGEFDNDEVEVVKDMCKALDVNIADFKLK